ncbi:twin-arginine translocation signal domain-containing protein [Candidatus Nanohalobium constans]|uniref:Twin-arginine translocation signal domain-containing protein n=1 Tax=Candidatus Nanohalobium constans TaxID=2565781 RepID=A0A5Q0UFJ8_9ARCH|nr:twin-arginine translocation signal domain-containing protein [Candidatus Nanohalobium constans]QGA80304.1 hypothetical protein LC1Nh_0403 [Candidatus Nanohalobium constans]
MKQENEEAEGNISRRKFLKKAGLGLAGVGAFSMLPASAVDIKSSDLKFFGTDSNTEFDITDGGPATFDTEVVMNSNADMSSSDTLKLPTVNGDPSNPEEGEIWYDSSA